MIDVEKFKLPFAKSIRVANTNRQAPHNWVAAGHAPFIPAADEDGSRSLKYDETKALFVMARLVDQSYCPATAGLIASRFLDALGKIRRATRLMKDPKGLTAEQRKEYAEARDAKFVVMARCGGGQFACEPRKEPRLFSNVSGTPVMHHEIWVLDEIDRMVRPRVADELGLVGDDDD